MSQDVITNKQHEELSAIEIFCTCTFTTINIEIG